MLFLTSDTHFGHSNIIKFCNRPFNNVNQMDDAIINNFNTVAEKNDLIVHLGDFAFGPRNNNDYIDVVRSYVERINAPILLCGGNHDRPFLMTKRRDPIWNGSGYSLNQPFCKLFKGVYPSGFELKITKQVIHHYQLPPELYKMGFTCSHYGYRVWNKSHRNMNDRPISIMLYGHSHSMLSPIRNSFDVGVDCWGFQLLSLPQVVKEVHKINAKLEISLT